MYHNFFIHLSFNGHLGCFHFLAIINSAAVNTGVHVVFSMIVSSGFMPSSGLVGHMIIGGSVTWYSYYAEQYGDFFKN